MEEIADWLKMLGVNFGTLGVVSLTDLEVILKILLLVATLVWTVARTWKLLKEIVMRYSVDRQCTFLYLHLYFLKLNSLEL